MDFKFCPKCPIKKKAKTFDLSFFNFKLQLRRQNMECFSMHYLPGTNDFLIGCNYWSSEAGVSMWHEWSIEAVEKDFAALKDAGMNTVRLFPLWSDFQPVRWACTLYASAADRKSSSVSQKRKAFSGSTILLSSYQRPLSR